MFARSEADVVAQPRRGKAWLCGAAMLASIPGFATPSQGPAAAASAVQPAPAQRCAVRFAKNWTASERWVWCQVCAGRSADLRTKPESERVLSSEFLQTIVLRSPYKEAVTHQGVHLIGATFSTALELSDGDLPRRLIFEHSRFKGNVKLRRAVSSGYLALVHSHLEEGADLSFSSLNQVEIQDTALKRFDAASTVIRKQLVLQRVRVAEAANLFSARLEEGVFFHGSQFGALHMVRTNVRGDAYLRGVTIGSAPDANDGSAASIPALADMTGLVVGGTLWIDDNRALKGHCTRATWGPDARLILRDAKVGSLTTSSLTSAAWPKAIDLNGLAYERLSRPLAKDRCDPQPANGTSVAKELEKDLLAEPGDYYLVFLAKSDYSPQSYEQLASILARNGNPDAATDVRVAAKDFERKRAWSECGFSRISDCLKATWLTASWALIGYGQALLDRPLWWILGLSVLGAQVFRKYRSSSGTTNAAGVGALAYSFETLIPLVSLRSMHKDVDFAENVPRCYFYFHRIFGYVLASFIVAGLAGLTK